jgi:hypothetical protein
MRTLDNRVEKVIGTLNVGERNLSIETSRCPVPALRNDGYGLLPPLGSLAQVLDFDLAGFRHGAVGWTMAPDLTTLKGKSRRSSERLYAADYRHEAGRAPKNNSPGHSFYRRIKGPCTCANRSPPAAVRIPHSEGSDRGAQKNCVKLGAAKK